VTEIIIFSSNLLKGVDTINLSNLKKNKNWTPYLLIAPTVIYYIFFWLNPVITSIYSSFKGVDGSFTLQNYITVFTTTSFGEAFGNTAFIAGISIVIEFFIALALALLINKKFKGSAVFLFIAMVPMAIPAVGAAAIWKTGLTAHGWMNSLLYYLGFLAKGEKLLFLSGSKFSILWLVIIIDTWQVIPSMMIILLAGLQNLSKEAKEAGYVFGGNGLTVLRQITIPMLKPTIITAVILRLISAIQIWLIVVMLFGFDRIPLLLERVIYYKEELPRLDNSYQIASTYAVITSIIVTIAAVVYLKFSGAFDTSRKEVV